MKNNTFIIPAVDFYVLIPVAGYEFNTSEEVDTCLREKKYKLIPFSEVDGLSIRDLFDDHFFSNGFAVSAITLLNPRKIETLSILNPTNIELDDHNLIFHCFFTLFKTQPDNFKKSDVSIDKIIESAIENGYRNADLKTRGIYNCFLARYQDENYEATKERIKKLLNEQ